MTQTNYAVMRHASYSEGRINENGRYQTQDAAIKLRAFFTEKNISEIEIWYSPVPRAQDTAEYLSQILDIKNSLFKIEFLHCDKEEIQDNLPEENETFVLMISHEPDIEYYLKQVHRIYPKIYNCSIFVGRDEL